MAMSNRQRLAERLLTDEEVDKVLAYQAEHGPPVPAVTMPAARRSRVYAMAGSPSAAGDIAALAQGVEAYHAEAKQVAGDVKALSASVAKLERGVDDLGERLAGVIVNGGGDPGERKGNIRAERNALALFARKDDLSKLREIHASMSVDSDPDGGYFVMPEMSSSMTKKLFNLSPMRRLARVETITRGDAWVEPLDIGEPEAVWVGEKTPRTPTQTPKIGLLTVPLKEVEALAPVTQKLLDDGGFDLGAWLEGKLADKFGRSEGAAFISGDGVLKPSGILSFPIVSTADATRPWGQLQYFPSGNASGFDSTNPADALKDVVWGLRSPYRALGPAWLMNSNTASSIDKFKDANGHYIWRDSMTAGTPPMLLGYPVEFDEDMPDVSTNSFPIAFGAWRTAYVIIDRIGLRVLRDPFSNRPNVLFYGYRRVGGSVANTEAVKLFKIAVS